MVLSEGGASTLNGKVVAMAQCTIGAGIVVNGRISGEATVSVSGRVEGILALDDELIVETTGVVIADVEAESVSVHGTFEGTMTARDTIRLHAGCVVNGDVRAPRIIIEEGARFRGNIEMDVQLPAQAA